MRTSLCILLLIFQHSVTSAQELFVFTEPASNMPVHTTGFRFTGFVMKDGFAVSPEVMYGLSKKIMLHVDGVFGREDDHSFSGGGVYAKYRFYSNDEVHRHLRFALFGRAAVNDEATRYEEIVLNGRNTGMELGITGTQLTGRTAFSASVSGLHTMNNRKEGIDSTFDQDALDYTLSIGHLVLPKHYVNYRQTNMNFMLELLGQTIKSSGHSYLDIAPSLQFIFNSQTRVDIAWRQELYSNMDRSSTGSLLLRVEHLVFSWKKTTEK